MKIISILALLLISCGPSTPRVVDRTLDMSCPIVEAYGPALLSSLTKQPIAKFEALAVVCEAAHAVNESIIPLSVAGAPAK